MVQPQAAQIFRQRAGGGRMIVSSKQGNHRLFIDPPAEAKLPKISD
jgi:hypothetical protein